MLFNSISFLVFLPLVFFLYWGLFAKNITQRNVFLLVVSYIFYGWWDWRFLGLIAFSTIVDYGIALNIVMQTDRFKRKMLLLVSLAVNLGLLGVFKYCNFFIENFQKLLASLGVTADKFTLNIILPVGISFYTFQTLSYTIDVYRDKLTPTRRLVDFAAFVSFFPQLVAGPIERASNLLPQFKKQVHFSYPLIVSGLRLILLGFIKKVVIADNCAIFVNQIFENYQQLPSSELVLGAVYFAIQIYGDFSGYSDIAIGTAYLLGFDLMVNFRTPYLSRNIAEFWRRWHISLSTWFRDYLYIPLGGSRHGKGIAIRNTFIIFLVSGFWHGANWTFIIWGGIHAICFIPLLLFDQNRKYLSGLSENKMFPRISEIGSIFVTFSIVCLGWIFFRAPDVNTAIDYVAGIFTVDLFSLPGSNRGGVIFVLIMFSIDWFTRESSPRRLFVSRKEFRWSIYCIGLIFLYYYGRFNNDSFIYFQF